MGLFDFLKKEKKLEYDPSDIKITDLKKGFVFEYDLKTWLVEAEYLYDWGNNYFSSEYKINSGDEERFLSVDNDDELFLTLTKKVKIRAIKEDLPEFISENETPPKKLVYQNITFYYDGESIGSFKDLNDAGEADSKFISWEYFDEEEKYTLCLEQWDEEDFDASFGQVVKPFEISNILPGNN